MSVWRTLRDRYHRLDAASHRVLGHLLKVSIAAYFIGCTLYLTTKHVIWPWVENYKTEIEQAAEKAIGKPVTIGTMHATWEGFHPRLVMDNVAMRDESGQQILVLPQVSATLSWRSIPAMTLRLKQLEIVGPELDIRRDVSGNIYVAEMLFDSAKDTDSDGAQWVLTQDEIVIRDGQLHWHDDMRKAPELALKDVRIALQNGWWSHKLTLTGTPPASLAAPIEVRADFRHPLFASDIADVRQWKGVLYADLHNTDLIAWKPYFDYPFELNKGYGSVRAWLSLDHARVADFTADLSLKAVATRLGKNLEPLNLTEISGRISAREHGAVDRPEGKLTFGENGHSVELINVSLKTEEGLILPETSLSEEFSPGLYGEPTRTAIRLKQIDLETLGQFTQYVPMTKDVRKILADLSPQGRLKDFEIQWEGNYPNVVSYRVGGEFAGLTLKSQPVVSDSTNNEKKQTAARIPGIPGFNNLTGRIHANQLGGNIELDSENLTLHFPGVFKEPVLTFQLMKMHAEWVFNEKNRQFEVAFGKTEFVQDGIEGSLSGKHIRPLNFQDKSPGYLDISGKLSGMDVKKLDRYLPTQTPDGLRSWLTGGIEEGFVRDVQFKVKGDLADFPFAEGKTGRRKGEFSVTAGIENAKLNYAPGVFAPDGVSPLWPHAENIQGRISVRGARMEIWAKTAQTANVALTDVLAVIPDMQSKDMQVEIGGNAKGALQDFVRYTNITPVGRWISQFTEGTKGSGNAQLFLKLSLPLEHIKDAKVRGLLQFENNDIRLLKDLPQLSNVKGKFEFHEKGFKLHDISTGFLSGDARVTGGTQEDGRFLIKAEGSLTMEGVRKEYPGLPHRVNGKTNYKVSINQRGRLPDIQVESSLKGVAFDFPAPLKKITNDTLPLKVVLTDQTPTDGSVWRDEIDITLGKTIAARYHRQKPVWKGAKWQVVRGGIGINAKPPEPASGVAMRVVTGPVNVDAWKMVLSSFVSDKDEKKVEATAEEGALQYFSPTTFSIKTPKLTTSGFQLDQVDLQAERREGSLQLGIKSRQVTGLVNLAEDAKEGHSKIVARLSALNIAAASISKASEVLEAADKPSALPNLDIIAENFEIYGKKLGRLELIAGNAPGSAGRQWNIDKLLIDNSGGTLNASGKWIAKKSANKTTMQYALKLKDAGNFLDRLGFKGVLRDGEGKLEGSLQWDDTPFALHKPSLSGKVSLSLKKGQFLPAEPGVAKLLNVLSLQSLPRRLVLDFRDVFSKGYAFDRATATADISKGVLNTDNLKMRGVGSNVLMEGTADIVNETQDLHVVVIPNLDASAASIAAAFAGGPVIGVGAFLAQLFLKDPLMKAMTFEYQVTGSWTEPTVTKLARKDNKEAEDASSPANNTDN